jgi:hypothetical protein
MILGRSTHLKKQGNGPFGHRTRMRTSVEFDQPYHFTSLPPLSLAGVPMHCRRLLLARRRRRSPPGRVLLQYIYIYTDDGRVQNILWTCTENAYRNTRGPDKWKMESPAGEEENAATVQKHKSIGSEGRGTYKGSRRSGWLLCHLHLAGRQSFMRGE